MKNLKEFRYKPPCGNGGRVSKKAVVNMVLYLKKRKIQVSAFSQVYGQSWIIKHKNSQKRFTTNVDAYNFLLPFFKEETKKEYQEYIQSQILKEKSRDQVWQAEGLPLWLQTNKTLNNNKNQKISTKES